jgi:hypothetical protein
MRSLAAIDPTALDRVSGGQEAGAPRFVAGEYAAELGACWQRADESHADVADPARREKLRNDARAVCFDDYIQRYWKDRKK